MQLLSFCPSRDRKKVTEGELRLAIFYPNLLYVAACLRASVLPLYHSSYVRPIKTISNYSVAYFLPTCSISPF